MACVVTVVWLRSSPDAAYSLPTPWAGCFVVGAATRVYAARLRPGPVAAAAALTGLLALSVVPLRGHALTYLAGGPVIAVLTSTALLSWRFVEAPLLPRSRVPEPVAA